MNKRILRPFKGFFNKFRTVIALILIAALIAPSTPVNAASYKFKYKRISDGKTIKYNYTIPIYMVDGVKVDTSETQPIISGNTAMCSADALFGSIEGVTVKYYKSTDILTFTYNDNKIVMYLGETYCKVNDEEKDCGTAPFRVKYTKSGKYANLVPTRFVAENLGMEYTWTQATSTVTIKTPKTIEYDGNIDYYLGTLGKINFDGKDIPTTKTPSYIYDDNALLCLRAVFNHVPGLDYSYDSSTGEIHIIYKEITMKLWLESTLTYVNGMLDTAPIAPCMIYNFESDTRRVYIPGRYVFETLGFDYQWDSKTGTSVITTTEETGIYHPDFDDSIIYNAERTYSGSYRQTLEFPIMEGIQTEDIVITDRIYDNLITFDLAGNYMDFYRHNEIENTGQSVIQLQILYYEADDITRVNIYTRTDADSIILGHRDLRTHTRIVFTLDWPPNLYDKIIVLDAGHGGTDPGAVQGGYNEKDLNFKIVYTYCKELFDDSNIKVYYSRYDDTLAPLHDRPTVSARVGADFFVSVHHNSYYQKYQGTTVYYSVKNEGNFNGLDSATMAKIFCDNLVNALGTNNMGTLGGRNYVVVSEENAVPSVLLEIGFMSNPDELKRMVKKSFQKKVAKCIYNTVKQIYKEYGY